MPGTVYRWRDGTRLAIDAQMAGEHIEHLRKKANGALTPAQVLADARDAKSVLHGAFEWDDNLAAEHYRETQARYLIGALVVTVKPRGVPHQTRAFVSVDHKDSGVGYTSLPVAMSDIDLRRQVLAKAWRELRAWQHRYDAYAELAALFQSIDEMGTQNGLDSFLGGEAAA
jgi:hypothetical protein